MVSSYSPHRLVAHRVPALEGTGEFSLLPGKSPCGAVLVVDDEPLIRWSLAQTLGDRGFTVCEAGDGRSAMREIAGAEAPFAVVVLDYRLPDSQDFTLLAWIRRQSPRSSIILMTAHGAPEVSRGALELGAFRVVAKPFEIDDLTNLVVEASRQSG
jgi:DNA-binding NtrC family response regulator